MPHYSNIDLNSNTPRRVCQYCGRPLKAGLSMNQGCGDICRNKHRNSKYRVISVEVDSYGKSHRYDKFK